MMSPKQKQGYVGDISSKSTVELMELLSRQEKILCKTKFVESLPDKGAKVRTFYEKLQQLLSVRTQQADGGHVFPPTGQMSQNQVQSVPTGLRGEKQEQKMNNSSLSNKLHQTVPVSSFEDEMRLPQQEQNSMLTTSTTTMTTQPQSDNSSEVEMKNDITENKNPKTVHDSDLEGSLKKMQISAEVSVMDRIQKEKTTNAYSKAIQNATAIHIPSKPNSGLKNTDISNMPREYKFRSRDQNYAPPVHVTPRAVEESAATPPLYKHKESKLIPLNESLSLQKTQKVKQEELQARHAAEKLTQRLGVTMEQYNPEGVDMSYRNQEQEVDSDDDLE
ncbi:DNA-directed RNA polymerase II subunit GRINL1A-like isoform X1 [Mizuhopecten yessoensis]|uniref:DNA-directed RNA polymerase II subunit GRINL1A n=1 Tax=Mizuhopecten yessoensis TaxID=6573 RepID=A0A210PMP5_MIZYE|nr:DNA-directed RNA polymerase II subunit GRINL1A-like isoform X1 [Mizuhopecten yessoensis]XP_021379594.1 DNA-directed RNA polymerase II subunit GRINL1A-like isoform X1 [Mizuhopecten yessoensis]OWF37775.1 DNA-directed RNA polymerase II subunit GRINL1A [Mizuhopecten yessoensis]